MQIRLSELYHSIYDTFFRFSVKQNGQNSIALHEWIDDAASAATQSFIASQF